MRATGSGSAEVADRPSREDRELFRAHLRDVTPLEVDVVDPHRKRIPAFPRQSQRAEREVLLEMAAGWREADIETGEELVFHRPGVQNAVLRRLRRGHYVVQSELDLHGLRTDEAKLAVIEFMHYARTRGLSCVRIIHGKGQGSQGRQPVLKPKVARWLAVCDDVLAYCSARANDGGTGAIYVLLRRNT
ncbi:MAG: Smr/MutS family protein [Gammaproteobacteria bacterium]|nr:Smr/MutS family protein [Gammaproteobacteria bacterium]